MAEDKTNLVVQTGGVAPPKGPRNGTMFSQTASARAIAARDPLVCILPHDGAKG